MSRRDGMVYSKDGRRYPRVVRHLAVRTERIDLEDLGYYYESDDDRYYNEVVSLCGQRIHEDADHKYRSDESDVTCKQCIKKGDLNPTVQNRTLERGYSR